MKKIFISLLFVGTVLFILLFLSYIYIYNQMFEAASNENNITMERCISLGGGVNIRDDYLTTPLMYICNRNNEKIAESLLKQGAKPNLQDGDGYTALMYACQNAKSDELIAILIKYGADKNIKNKKGETAIDIARKNHNNSF